MLGQYILARDESNGGTSCEVVIRSNYTDVSRMDIRTHGHTDNLTDGEWTVESGRPGLYGLSNS